jgi:hypothetical protein
MIDSMRISFMALSTMILNQQGGYDLAGMERGKLLQITKTPG